MSKKVIISICAGAAAIFILLIGIIVFWIYSNTEEAKKASEEFISLLGRGELDELRLQYYAYEEENVSITGEEGQAQVNLLSEQEFAEKYGYELVMDKEESEEEKFLKVLMKYSTIQHKTGITYLNSSKLQLVIQGPDIKTWMEEITEQEISELSNVTENHLEDFEARLASGDIPQKTESLIIKMKKQNEHWRFEVTEEIERNFFGGIYDLLGEEQEETKN